jgi:acylglycerol lipase
MAFTRQWEAAQPRAAVALLHGLAEHSGRYEHVGAQFAAAGIETYAIDLRGFGASGGARAWVNRWSELHDDLEERITALRTGAPTRPLVLYGHSLGGLVCLGYVLDGRSEPDLLVLSAPAISADIPAWQRGLVALLGRIAPRIRIPNRLSGSQLSTDPAVGVDYFADPLNVHASTARFGVLALAEQRRVAAAVDRVSIPTLVIHGGDDSLVPTATSAVFEGRPGVTRQVFEGLRHETHNEPDGDRVLDAVVAWIRSAV